MEYTKPTLTYEAMADKLIVERHLIADRDLLIERLKSVNYYRLSGYWYPYLQEDDAFKPDTSFEDIWAHYVFDRKFRLSFWMPSNELKFLSNRRLLTNSHIFKDHLDTKSVTISKASAKKITTSS